MSALRVPRAVAPILIAALASPLPCAADDATHATSRPARAPHGMVASVCPLASGAGAEVLRRGGNAVDAAVATALALAVTWPAAGNLGGGGFMLVRLADGRAVVIDYRETAPAAAHARSYLDEDGRAISGASLSGPRAAAVPGTVAGLAWALERYGTWKWADVVEPARRLAGDGFEVSPALARSLAANAATLARDREGHRLYARDGRGRAAGTRFVQNDLAATLRRLQRGGPQAFYTGTIAARIEKTTRGWITRDDLARYRVVERAPLSGRYRGHEILTVPPPSSGGVALLHALALLERWDLRASGRGSARTAHLVTEALRRAMADRATHLGDPGFVHVPAAALASRAYADSRAAAFDTARATPSRLVAAGDPAPYESAETTHFTVVDGAGNVVANTYTLNESYGSGVMVRGMGFLLNNEMDDFTTAPGVPNTYGLIQGEANAVGAGRRPASSMTPTIVLRDGRPWFALGSPGGPVIISAVLQVILNVVDHALDLQAAVDAPRLHHQWLPDTLRVEPGALDAGADGVLRARGHALATRQPLGDVHAVMVDTSGTRIGASDRRLGGAARGN